MIRNTRVYTEQELVCNGSIKLNQQASHHLIKVLRLKPEASLTLFNGDGHDYPSTLTNIEAKTAVVLIKDKEPVDNESTLNLTLLQGISRSDRMDTTIQKSVELGVNEIIPVLCEHSNFPMKQERIQKKMAHWKKIIISACEQSGRAVIPRLTDITDFNDAIQLHNDHTKIILSPITTQSLASLSEPKNVCLLIGPEGGFSTEETTSAIKDNYEEVSFGPRILRTETAGPAAISAIQTLWGDLR